MYILSDSEISSLYTPPKLEDDERQELFFLNDQEKDQINPKDSVYIKAFYILLLGYYKVNPTKIDVDIEAAIEDLTYIQITYYPDEKFAFVAPSYNQKYKLYTKILSAFEYMKFGKIEKAKLQVYLSEIVLTHFSVVEIFDEVTDWLRNNRIEIPSYKTLQDLISIEFKKEKKRTIEDASKLISLETKKLFDGMLFDPDKKDLFDQIRFEVRDYKRNAVLSEIRMFDLLSPLYGEAAKIVSSLGISKGRIQNYAHLLSNLQLGTIKSKKDEEIYLIISCFIYFRYRTLNDYLVDALIYQIRLIEQKGSEHAKSKMFEVRSELDKKLVDSADILSLLLDNDVPSNELRKESFKILPKNELVSVISYLRNSVIEKDIYFWEYVDSSKKVIAELLRKIIIRLKYVDGVENGSLFAQLEKAISEINDKGRILFIDKRLVRKTKKYLYEGDEVISLRAEFSIYRLIANRLQREHWYVKNSTRNIPLNEMLLTDQQWENKESLKHSVNSAALNTPVDELVRENMALLNHKLKIVPERMQSGANETVILEQKDGKEKWTIKRTKKENVTNQPLFKNMQKVDLTKIIYTTASSTNFFEEIRHITGRKKPKDALATFIACMIANGTRQGIYKMADLCEFSHDKLKTFESNFMAVDHLRRACDKVSNATSNLEIFEHYNYRPSYIHGSADGQKQNSRKSTKRTRFSRKNFGKGKGLFAHTLSVNHVPVNVKLDSLNTHESHNIFDLLYNNATEIEVDAVSTDTHGVNRFNFAILGLSDWIFQPRYAKTNNIIESLFSVIETKDGWELALKEKIDTKAIYKGWDYVERIIVSLHQKEIRQSDLVAKLSKSSPTDHSLKALREYDRLLKAIYILEYMDDVDLRRYIQTVLNRGEAYHQLQRAFEQVGSGKGFRGKSDAEIDMWYECSRLMANCIIYFNSVILDALLKRYISEGRADLVEHLKRISPVAWAHIIMGGKYEFDDLNDTPDIYSMVSEMLAA